MAAEKESEEIVQLLLTRNGIDTNAKDEILKNFFK